jgi:hypothetical protein
MPPLSDLSLRMGMPPHPTTLTCTDLTGPLTLGADERL